MDALTIYYKFSLPNIVFFVPACGPDIKKAAEHQPLYQQICKIIF